MAVKPSVNELPSNLPPGDRIGDSCWINVITGKREGSGDLERVWLRGVLRLWLSHPSSVVAVIETEDGRLHEVGTSRISFARIRPGAEIAPEPAEPAAKEPRNEREARFILRDTLILALKLALNSLAEEARKAGEPWVKHAIGEVKLSDRQSLRTLLEAAESGDRIKVQ